MVKDRIHAFMQDRSFTASKLAEMIGVQPSSISHILSGRNKPGYDFLLSILNRFPEIDPDWLIAGRGNMYRSDETAKTSGTDKSDDKTGMQPNRPIMHESPTVRSSHADQPNLFSTEKPDGSRTDSSGLSVSLQTDRNDSDPGSRKIDKIIILYTDGSFGIYSNH